MTKLTTRLTTNLTRVHDGFDEYSYIRNSTRNVLEELKVGLPHYTKMEIISRWTERQDCC